MGLLQPPSLGYDIHLNLFFTVLCCFFFFSSALAINLMSVDPVNTNFLFSGHHVQEFGGYSIEIYC